MMPGSNKQSRNSAASIIDVLVACAVLALIGCVVLPALSKERDDARIAECADHLKQLGQAAHQYAADFEGKFFYNRALKLDDNGKYAPDLAVSWFDPEMIGRYIKGDLMYQPWYGRNAFEIKEFPEENPPPDWPHYGLGGGVFVCPADEQDAGRSYNMNFWAGNGYPPFPDPAKMPPRGELFDSQSPQLEKLLLFTDVMEFTKSVGGYVSINYLGKFNLPGERFGAGQTPTRVDIFNRYNDKPQSKYYSPLDYVRHGENELRSLPVGAVNIGYADGHVSLRSNQQLCNPITQSSTYNTLWSLIDQEIDESAESR